MFGCSGWLLIALLAAASVLPARAGEIRVAAAADLSFALSEIAGGFEKQTGNTVRLSFGSSGNLFTQIENGAPFDLFFSADEDYPRKLQAAGLAPPGSLRVYARGRLVLWTARGSSVDLERLGMNALLDSSVRRIAIANPAHAPYGRAAVAAMHSFHLYERVRDRLVLGENVSQAAQFAQSGNADIGIVALSIATAPTLAGKGKYWEIPPSAYPPLKQAVVIPGGATDRTLAEAFLAYLETTAAQQVLHKYGFLAPEKQ